MGPLERLQNLKVRGGLLFRILAPTTIIFAVISGALVFWISELSQEALLRQARRENTYQVRVARELLSVATGAFHDAVQSPLLNDDLAPYIARGMADQVGELLRQTGGALGTDAMYVFDVRGRFLAAQRATDTLTPPAGLRERARRLLETEAPETGWVLAERDLIAFDGMPVAPGHQGRLLGYCDARIVRNDFGDPVGALLAFRFFGEDRAYARALAERLGAGIHFVGGPVRAGAAQREHAAYGLKSTAVVEGAVALNGDGGAAAGTLLVRTEIPAAFVFGGASSMRNRILGGALLALVCFVVTVRQVTRRPLRAVDGILAHLDEIGRGRIDRELQIRTGDEIEALAHGVNRTTASLRSIVGRLRQSFGMAEDVTARLVRMGDALNTGTAQEENVAGQLEDATSVLSGLLTTVSTEMEALQESALQNATSAEQITVTMERFSARAGELFQGAEDTSSSMAEMSSSVSEVARNMTDLAGLVRETSGAMGRIDGSIRDVRTLAEKTNALAESLAEDAAGRGRSAMNGARKGMDEILVIMTGLKDTVGRVGESTRNIDRIIALNYEISEQVKLLSLNASILASQAGEAGKGFSVVADAIGRLSEKTNASIQDIETHVAAIREEGQKAVQETQSGIASVQRGVERVGEVETVLDGIIEATGETREAARRMAKQTEAQFQVSTDVAGALARVAHMAEGVERSTTEQAETGRYVSEVAEMTKARAEEIATGAREALETTVQVRGHVARNAETAGRLTDNAVSARQAVNKLEEAVSVITGVIDENRQFIRSLQDTATSLKRQSDDVSEQIAVFQIEGGGRPQVS